MIYPVRSRIIRRNPLLLRGLGEQLENAAALMAADPGVSALQSLLVDRQRAYDSAVQRRNGLPKTVQRCTKQRVRSYCRQVANPEIPAADAEVNRAREALEDAKRRLAEAEQRVWDRISKAVPYKAYIIQPVVDRAANTIVYQLTKDGQPVGAPHQRLDEAKAVVDGEIAAGQEQAVKQWSDERVAAEAAQVAASAPASMPVPVPATAVAQPAAKTNLVPILAVGGAAVAALVLLK